MQTDAWDVIIVGGGAAGLNAALVLGRCRRSALLFDDGRPRNAASRAMHGMLGHDGVPPATLRALALSQLAPYRSVVLDDQRVVDAQRSPQGFRVRAADGRWFSARKLLLAGGVVDELPEITGFRELYGLGVFHCPYCDGWEVRDQALAVYGRGDDKGGGLALEMLQWSRDVVLCTDGPSGLSPAFRARLDRHRVVVREEKLTALDVKRREPHRAAFDLVFASGPPLARNALFFNTGRHLSNDLADRLGCGAADAKGCRVDPVTQMSPVPGVYIAGDASRDVLQVVVAAAEGAAAAIAINCALLDEDLR